MMTASKQLCAYGCAAGGIGSSDPPANPCSWLSDKLWGELVRLSNDVPGFAGLEASFKEDPSSFKVGGGTRLCVCALLHGCLSGYGSTGDCVLHRIQQHSCS
jgi:hypothetical protein